MRKHIELFNFVVERLRRSENVILLVVAESFGSSPGRTGYKLAVAADGDLIGSIGGGVMEVELVERAKQILSALPPSAASASLAEVVLQEHRKNSAHPSGMICSGEQTVILKLLTPSDLENITGARESTAGALTITASKCSVDMAERVPNAISFEKISDTDFTYSEPLGAKNLLVIIGGGHCCLALTELMSRMDFRISIFDDRPELNTLEKNRFAEEITIIESYEDIAEYVPEGENVYVVVMTLGYKTDAVVIRRLLDREFEYIGVLGSKAKMATLLREMKDEGHDPNQLARIHTPIGLPINSHTPEEIAVSIAAEIISVKNSEA